MRIAIDFIRNLFIKTTAIFISNSNDCPCYLTVGLLKRISIKNLNLIECKNLSDKIKIAKFNNKRFLISVHGDVSKMQCYYWSPDKEKIFIDDKWWEQFARKVNIVYFQVCFGELIINNSSTLSQAFKSWVSYSDKVRRAYSQNGSVDKINQNFYSSIMEAIGQKKNSLALKAAIMAAYHNMESSFYDLDGKIIPGFSIIIHSVGRNINTIRCS